MTGHQGEISNVIQVDGSDDQLQTSIFCDKVLTFLCKSIIMENLGFVMKHGSVNLDVTKLGSPL